MWVILAGRGFGKTRTSCEDCWHYADTHPNERIAVVAPTIKDLRETMLEGPSGIIQNAPKGVILSYNKSFSEIKFTNGAQINGYSAEEPERLRGPNFHRAFLDEVGSWNRAEAWDMLNFALRLGENPRCIITTTPKPTKIIRDLVEMAKDPHSGIVLTTGSTFENADNLGAGFIDYVKKKYEGTRLGRQELYAELLADTPGALWNRSQLEELRLKQAPQLVRVVVAIDPAISNEEGSDETGIIVAGVDNNQHFYVLDDRTGKYSPEEWAREAVAQYHKWQADRIVAECNQGGDMVEHTIKMVNRAVPVTLVRATRGKAVRAEPVSALYEQRRAHHVGFFQKLEDSMCEFTCDFDKKTMGYSPDRVDAMVWAAFDLIVGDEISIFDVI